MDVSRYAASSVRPRVTGDRSHRSARLHAPERLSATTSRTRSSTIHSRLAYVELHRDERAFTVTGFLERALAFFAEHGIACKRLMTDNAFAYVKSRSLRELLAARGIKHLTTEPYRPRTNGKVVALPPDDGGLSGRYGARLPLTSTAKRGAATLARALQPAQTTQPAWRPTSIEPRSQRLWGRTASRRRRAPRQREPGSPAGLRPWKLLPRCVPRGSTGRHSRRPNGTPRLRRAASRYPDRDRPGRGHRGGARPPDLDKAEELLVIAESLDPGEFYPVLARQRRSPPRPRRHRSRHPRAGRGTLPQARPPPSSASSASSSTSPLPSSSTPSGSADRAAPTKRNRC